MQDLDSDARFALWWSHLSREQQVEHGVRFSRGSLDELRCVVRSLATLEKSAQAHQVVSFDGLFRFDHNMLKRPNARWRRWEIYLQERFVWHTDENLAALHLCIEDFYLGAPVEVKVPHQPSQHERLEAALFLREWARDKIPPDELRLLLPKL